MSAGSLLSASVSAWNENGRESPNEAGSKRRCLHFPVRDKLKHVKRLESGESAKVIARELGLSPATVRRWKSQRNEFERSDDVDNRKRLRLGANPHVDEAVHVWYQEQKVEGVTPSGTILKGKAKELNEKMGGDKSFNASDGWLTRWRHRQGINRGVEESENKSAISYEESLSVRLKTEMNLRSSQVFNVAVTSLNWKVLPLKGRSDGIGYGRGARSDRVSIMTCSNADATFKLRLLVTGKSAHPRGLKNLHNLAIPVFYAHEENATIDTRIFGDWFVNEFAPAVSRFLAIAKMPQRALLLLDATDPTSPDLAIGGIETMLVPANESLSVTRLKADLIGDLKTRYRRGLLESASYAQDKGHDPVKHVQTFGMKDMMFRLDEAWRYVPTKLIVDSWNNLLTPLVALELDPLAIVEDPPEDNVIRSLLRKITGDEDLTEVEVERWINDEEIVSGSETIELVKHEEPIALEDKDVITPTQAVLALDDVITFFERHARLSEREIAALRKARDQAYSLQIENP